MKNRKPKIVVAPKGCESYLTAGKEYEVAKANSKGLSYKWSFTIIDDNGAEINCLQIECAHLNDKNWRIKKYE